MDIHRSRFVPYPIHPITAVAFSRSSNEALPPGSSSPALKLAIGRQNGAIELWNPLRGEWVQEKVFGEDDKSIDGLTWTREPDETDSDGRLILGQHRLFSIASSPAVTEWDMRLGQVKRRSTGNFSEVWCLAAQPRAQMTAAGQGADVQSQELVAGCGDGTIVLLSTLDDDVQFKRFLARHSGRKAKCVSINYQNRNRVLAGFMDSTIRIYDTKTASVLRTMSLGVGIPGAPKDAVVWQVKALPNGDIVSGDSNGDVVFWDGKLYSLLQRIRGHDSECLDVVASADGKTVFSGSMDGRTAIYRQSTNPSGQKSWAKGHHRRTHNGRVRSMAAFDSPKLSVVVSGGDDLVPMINPLRAHGRENIRALSAMPQMNPVVSSRHARLFASWWGKRISIWRIARKAAMDVSSDPQPPRKLVAKLVLDTKDSIRSVSMSDDGRCIAACTASEVKIFQLRRRLDAEALGVRRVEVPSSLQGSGAHLLKFSPDGKWLALASHDEVQVIRLASDPTRPKHIRIINQVAELERRHHKNPPQSGFLKYEDTITQLAFACDSSVLVSGDLNGYLDSWILEGSQDPASHEVRVLRDESKADDSNASSSEDSDSSSDDDDDATYAFYGQCWKDSDSGRPLPKLDSAPLVLSFRPSVASTTSHSLVNGDAAAHRKREKYFLWVMTAQHKMYEFDVLAGKLSDWSRRNPTSILPDDFTKILDRVMGAIWDVKPTHQRLWLYGPSWLYMFNIGELDRPPKGKRKRQSDRGTSTSDKRLKPNTGAGGPKNEQENDTLPSVLKRYDHGRWQDIDVQPDEKATTQGQDEYDEEDDDDEQDAQNLRLTRVKSMSRDKAHSSSSQHGKSRLWHCVFTYRPILGIVPLDDDDDDDDVLADGENQRKKDRPLEVVLVERPLWDARGK